MSILSSTGAGLSGKIYMRNSHQRVMYYSEKTAIECKYQMFLNAHQYVYKVCPIMLRKKNFWVKRSQQYLGKTYEFEINLSTESAYKLFGDAVNANSENPCEEFCKILVKKQKDIIHKNLQDIMDKVSAETDDEIQGFEMISDNWGTTNSFPEEKSANDYV